MKSAAVPLFLNEAEQNEFENFQKFIHDPPFSFSNIITEKLLFRMMIFIF